MTYDKDITDVPVSSPPPQIDDVCYILTIIVVVLMIIAGLPSIVSVYDNPLPAILTLGLAALVMSILYLALIIKNSTRPN